jgi:hypothetical protein
MPREYCATIDCIGIKEIIGKYFEQLSTNILSNKDKIQIPRNIRITKTDA